MSLWGNWKCSYCGKEWYGGIGWFATRTPTREQRQDRVDKICGCKKKMTKEDSAEAIVIAFDSSGSNEGCGSQKPEK